MKTYSMRQWEILKINQEITKEQGRMMGLALLILTTLLVIAIFK